MSIEEREFDSEDKSLIIAGKVIIILQLIIWNSIVAFRLGLEPFLGKTRWKEVIISICIVQTILSLSYLFRPKFWSFTLSFLLTLISFVFMNQE
jgi:phosphoglycerol transferase MdoB-like AlkP superfamily enzyme